MSKTETDLPERLSSAGASPLEQRLLKAASGELPSVELSERMARAIGVSLPAAGLTTLAAGSKTAAAATKSAGASALVPWISGVVVVAVAAGAFVATGPSADTRPAASAAAVAAATPSVSAAATPLAASPPNIEAEIPQRPEAEAPPSAPTPAASPRLRSSATANELAAQIALVDAARSALASGGAARALSSVRDYQADYPNGAFRPEVAAIKIEALLKLGRKSEARALAERFVSSYGPGPLADRVTRLVGAMQP